MLEPSLSNILRHCAKCSTCSSGHNSQWNSGLEKVGVVFVFWRLLLAIPKCPLRQLLFKCSCTCCRMVFQAVEWPQECCFLSQSWLFIPTTAKDNYSKYFFYHKTCKVDSIEVLLTPTSVYISFFFLNLLFLCWSKPKQAGTELQAWQRTTATDFKHNAKAVKNYFLIY